MGKKKKFSKLYGGYAVPVSLDRVINYFTGDYNIDDFAINFSKIHHRKLLLLIAKLVVEVDQQIKENKEVRNSPATMWLTENLDLDGSVTRVYQKYYWEIDRLIGFPRNKPREENFNYLEYVVFMIRISHNGIKNCIKKIIKKKQDSSKQLGLDLFAPF